jgi:ERCC4-type nuclease
MSTNGSTPSEPHSGATTSPGLPTDCVLLVDDREQDPEAIRQLLELGAVEDRFTYGDLFICNTTTGIVAGIEHKKPNDLLSSLANGRLDSQLAGLIGECDVPILLVHGDMRASAEGRVIAHGFETGWSYDSVFNKLQTYQELGVRLQFCPYGDEAFVRRIIALARYFCKPHHHLTPRVHGLEVFARETDAPTLALAQLPGVGVDRARKLIAHFGTLQAVGNASVNDLRFVEGIGPKVAQRIHRAFR